MTCTVHHRCLRVICAGFAAGLLLASGAFAQMRPAQDPLLSQYAPPPKPNLMVTMDDSGSMLAHFVPEGTFAVNGKNVTFPNGAVTLNDYWMLLAPNDPSFSNSGYSTTNGYAGVPATSSKNTSNWFELSPFSMQMRAASVNRIAYDPTVRYLPWYKPDGSARMANAAPTKALWDPVDTVWGTGTYDVTQANVQVSTRWCTISGNCTSAVTRRWWGGIFTVLKAGADPNKAESFDVYDIAGSTVMDYSTNSSGKSVTLPYSLPVIPAGRSDCVADTKRCTKAEEQQNYANWFQYYRSRMLLAKAAMSEVVVSSQGNAPRFGFATINSEKRTVDGAETPVVRIPVREYTAAQRSAMVTDIMGIKAYGGTPLRSALARVGDYFSRKGIIGNPWSDNPGASGSPVLACRRSYNILMTDGYYNDSPAAVGDVDGVDGAIHKLDITGLTPVPPTRYIAGSPYQDGYSDTLADFASKYYVNDLQTNALNKVMPISGDLADSAYWQHLNQFTVSLGVSGTLPAGTLAERRATIAAIRAGTKSWPNPASGMPQKIDDLFHAAVNAHGDYFQANNAGELTAALVSAVGRASAAGRAEAGVGISSNQFVADSLVYVPTYRSGSWFGDIVAYELDPQTHTLRVDAQGSKVVRWTASASRPAAGSRNLFTLAGATLTGTAFTDTAMDNATKGLIQSSATGRADLINYLRGDASKEGDGSDATKPFRFRGDVGKLPDFINSPPVLVRNRSAGAFDLIPGEGSSYKAYLSAKQARAKGALFIGGNGGLLHAFDANEGNEVFGYFPRTTLTGLADLSKQSYGTTTTPHRLFVDGPLSENDAYFGPDKDSKKWRNVLLSSLGGGGKALFALEAPLADPTALGANAIMWETADSAMGYMLADARVGKLKGAGVGEGWKAFVGNGVYSSDGSATLLIIDLAKGEVEAKLVADSGGGNGLMGVRLVLNEEQEVYAAYAGDLKGNIWRFDFEGPDKGSWRVGFKGKPLFRAVTGSSMTPQPITAPPVYMAHPESGLVVVAGTGRLIDSGDVSSTQLQSIVGVRDTTLAGESSAGAESPFLSYLSSGNGKDALQVQTITPSTVSGYFDVTNSAVDWATKKGWTIDLGGPGTGIDAGARVIVSPKRVLTYTYVDVVVPGGTPAACESSNGKGYGFMLQALTGARPTAPIFDTNNDGKVDAKDDGNAAGFISTGDGRDGIQAASGDIIGTGSDDGGVVRQQSCMPDPSGFCTEPNTCLVVILTAGDTVKQCLPFKPTVKDRVWQQIMNPPTPDKDAE